MTLVLFLVGLLATAAGFVTIGFGIPINAFSLGNTLIIAGTIAVAAGLILIGLAVAIGQLKRIAEGLSGRPIPRSGRASESVETMVPPTARMTPAPAVAAPVRAPDLTAEPLPEMFAPEPHMPEPPRMPAPPPRAPEPRFPATASEPASAPGPLDWLRAKTNSPAPKPSMPMPSMPMPSMPMPSMPMPSMPMPSMPMPAAPAMPPAMAEPPMVEVQDEAPLSPRSPQRPAMPPAPEPAMEPRVWSPSRGPAPPRAEQPMPRATPQPPQPKEKEGFDLVWPDRAPAAPGGEARTEARTEAKGEGKPAFDMPLPPIPARPERPDKRASAPPPKPAERGPAILKSGVIDGMPYTLYADGSIEAELPNGTVKFASVDALRAHLEKQS